MREKTLQWEEKKFENKTFFDMLKEKRVGIFENVENYLKRSSTQDITINFNVHWLAYQ